MLKRSASPHRFMVPTVDQCAVIIRALISGVLSPEEVSDWATEYSHFDNPQIFPEGADERVWDTLKTLSGADMPCEPGRLMYGIEDYRHWFKELTGRDP